MQSSKELWTAINASNTKPSSTPQMSSRSIPADACDEDIKALPLAIEFQSPAHKQLILRSAYQDLVATSRNITISNLQQDNIDLKRFLDVSRARVRELEMRLETMSDYNEYRLKALLGFAKGVETGLDQVRKI